MGLYRRYLNVKIFGKGYSWTCAEFRLRLASRPSNAIDFDKRLLQNVRERENVDFGGIERHRFGLSSSFKQTKHEYKKMADDEAPLQMKEEVSELFNISRENNPELAGDRCRTVMRPPQVPRERTINTVLVTFMDICKKMHRKRGHVMNFMLAAMGTSGYLDGYGHQCLVIKGRSAPKIIDDILRRYIDEYVICKGCKSPDTILSKENQLSFVRCEQCGCSRSVATIKASFVVRVAR